MLPAYAGMIRFGVLDGESLPGAPRVCGDDPAASWAEPPRDTVLPAYAGMIRRQYRRHRQAARAPRVCGDDPAFGYTNDWRRRCSPRMRG